MKKLFGVSIAAMLAVTPMIAGAAGSAPTAATTSSEPFVGVTPDSTAHIATTSYVQGAYNAAIGAINTVAATAGAAQTAQQVEDAIDAAAGAGLVSDNSGHLSVNGGDGIAVDSTSDKVTVDAGNGLEFGAANATDEGKLKVKAGAGIAVSSNGVAVSLKASTPGLDTTNGLGVKVDSTTIGFDENGNLTVAAAYDASGAATGVQNAIEGKLDDGATGYDINAKTLQVQSKAVATQVGVEQTVSSSYVTVYTDWANPTYTHNIGITLPTHDTNQHYTETAVSIPLGTGESAPAQPS